MTPNDERKVRDVMRRLDPEINDRLIQIRYGVNAARGLLEELVGTELAQAFIEDIKDDSVVFDERRVQELFEAWSANDHEPVLPEHNEPRDGSNQRN